MIKLKWKILCVFLKWKLIEINMKVIFENIPHSMQKVCDFVYQLISFTKCSAVFFLHKSWFQVVAALTEKNFGFCKNLHTILLIFIACWTISFNVFCACFLNCFSLNLERNRPKVQMTLFALWPYIADDHHQLQSEQWYFH